MTTPTTIAIVVFGSAIIYFLIALACQRRNTSPFAFFYADGEINGTDFSATFSGANITMTSIFIYFAVQATTSGASAFSGAIFWIAGVVLFYLLSPRLKESFTRGQTIHQYLAEAYSSRALQLITSLVTIFAFVGTVGLEFLGFSWFLQYFNVSQQNTFFIGLGLIVAMALYTVIGGYWATIKTDFLQVGLTVLGCIALLLLFIKNPWVDVTVLVDYRSGLSSALDSGSLLQDPALILGMAVLLIPFQFSVMDMWQRCVATGGSIRRFRRQTLLVGVALGIVFAIPVVIGLAQGAMSSGGEQPLFAAIESLAHPLLIGLATAMLLASVFSTADTLLLAASNSAIADLFARKYACGLTARVLDESKVTLRACQIAVIVLAVGSLLVFGAAALGFGLSDIIIGVFGAQSILGFLALYAILFPDSAKRRPIGAVAAAVIGLVLPVPLIVVGKSLGSRDLINAAPVISIALALSALWLVPLLVNSSKGQDQGGD